MTRRGLRRLAAEVLGEAVGVALLLWTVEGLAGARREERP